MGKASKLNLLSEGRGEHQHQRAHGQVARRRGRVIRRVHEDALRFPCQFEKPQPKINRMSDLSTNSLSCERCALISDTACS
jgi:hypothetical protein